MRPLLLLLVLLTSRNTFAQKYNFVNWTVEDGLVQSQAPFICQDVFRQLWIGTEGGMSCFDGKRFRSYTVEDGLPANHVSCMLSTKDSLLWIGTGNGMVCFNGSRFNDITFGASAKAHIRGIVEVSGKIHTLADLRLYEVLRSAGKRIIVSGDSSEKISAIEPAGGGKLLACVYEKGIYCGAGNNWQLAASLGDELLGKVVFDCYVSKAGDTLLACNVGLQVIRNKKTVPYLVKGKPPVEGLVLSITEDSRHHLWLGTDKGACEIAGNNIIYFNNENGLTDNSINHLFNDAEGNLWFATNADGIFKFRENTFTYYDKTTGLKNPIVMGVDQTSDGRVWIGGYGGGLFYTEGGKLMPAPGCATLNEIKISCLYATRQDQLVAGTLNRGIYLYDPSTASLQDLGRNNILPRGATGFSEDSRGNLLVGTAQGLFVRSRAGKTFCAAPEIGFVSAIRPFSEHQVIIGSARGLFLLDTAFNVTPFEQGKFGKSLVMCLARNGNRLFVGTSDKGIYLYNIATGKLTNYKTSDGLPNNFIYSIDAAEKNRLWAGTGFGISRVDIGPDDRITTVKNYGRSDGLLGMECNHNALLRDADSALWFGTTKGLFHFDPGVSMEGDARPLVLLRSVKLHSSPITDRELYSSADTWFDVPNGLNLAAKQNHLTFELGALYFTNPDDIVFSYKLDGIDKEYTSTGNPLVIYPALPPGSYVMRAFVTTKGGTHSVNEIVYPFVIAKAFYQTTIFQVFMIILLIGAGALIAWVITRGRHKRRQREKEMLARIREEEFARLRQRTAEDFHDEMGNSLTRISVLTDVLKVKLNGTGKEVSHLVQQIKDNTTALYNGSRDIIWSLNSRNDAIFEIAEHIRDIGNEMFQDTAVEFRCSHNIAADNKLRLKLDYSRNLTMVFKEAYTNILKHAGASLVDVQLELKDDNTFLVRLSDNGAGFGGQNVNGNGLKNMENRVRRMQGEFTVNSQAAHGTEIRIRLFDVFVN